MRTLLPASFNWLAYLLAAFVIRLALYNISWFSFLAIMISLYQFILLFNSIGFIIPTRYLLGSFMCIQFFVGPVLAYNGLDPYQYFMYRMRISEEVYFMYAIPAVCAFISGLHINAGKFNGEIINQQRIRFFVDSNPMLPYTFIIMGFFSSVISGFFSAELGFVFYLLGSFKFIGLFLLILGTKQLKIGPLVIVIGSIVSSSLGTGMFHDLLTWIIFTASVFGIKYKFGFKAKMIGLGIFIFLALTIQLLKGSYRALTSSGIEDSGAETFAKLYEQKNEDKGLFSLSSMADAGVRINQGFIITNIMTVVPAQVGYEGGAEMYKILEAAILPRVLAPNKLKAGDRTIFTKYSGIPLTAGTSMGLSSVGDAYINWGPFGGCIFMFILGVLYSEVLNFFFKYSRHYPALILFTALVFYYPIRPDCEMQTILGHLFKSLFLIYMMISIWKYTFYVPKNFVLNKSGG